MRLVSYGDGAVGRLVEGRVHPVVGASSMIDLIERWDGTRLTGPGTDDAGHAWDDVRLRVPVLHPSKIIAAPVNYHDHQAEMSVDGHVSSLGFFLEAPSSLLDPGGTVVLPYHDRRFDQEGELALVIGRTARKISPADAADHVFGYTGLLDITMRGGEDRSTRKSFETFTPMGPVLVTADEVGDPDDGTLRCWVNGELRQQATTADLIWNVAELVSYASWVTTLHPGDVVTTGTPAGVGPLEDGDTVRLSLSFVEVDLEVTVSRAGAVASHTAGAGRGPTPPAPHRRPHARSRSSATRRTQP